jgi:hypothetical protein
MNEKFETNNNMEEFRNKVCEDFRKEILAFKDLPESSFLDVRGQMGKLEPQEARNALGHGIMEKINNNSALTEQQIIELTHLWEKEIMGLTEKRVMYDGAGNVIG